MSGENVDEPADRSLRRLLHELEKGLGRGFLHVTRLLQHGDLTVNVTRQRRGAPRDSGNRHITVIGIRLTNLNRPDARDRAALRGRAAENQANLPEKRAGGFARVITRERRRQHDDSSGRQPAVKLVGRSRPAQPV